MAAGSLSSFDIITPGIPVNRDNCPVMTRVNAFIAQAGVRSTLEMSFRDRQGRAVDLSPVLDTSESASASASTSEDAILVRFRRVGNPDTSYASAEGTIVDPSKGVARVRLPQDVIDAPGIYQTDWAFIRDNENRLINNTLTSVERSLFVTDADTYADAVGPPTINEIRTAMWDHQRDNLLIDTCEYGADQILQAVLWPVQDFNDASPPLGYRFSSFNFPFRSQWIDAVVGRLYQSASLFYFRNNIGGTSGGGLTLNELDRGKEYAALAKQRLDAWAAFRDSKKVELNLKQGIAHLGSDYA